MIGHLDVNIIWRQRHFARPALFDDLHQLGGNVHAPFVVPAVFKPFRELKRGVVVNHIHIEFTLIRQTRKCKIAATDITDNRTDGVGAEAKVKFGVKRMTEEKFDDELPRLDLRRQSAQSHFVSVRRHAEGQLIAKFLGQFLFETKRSLIVELPVTLSQAERSPQIFLRQPLHPNQQAALVIRATRPLVNTTVNLFPAAKIEIADAKVGAGGNEKRLLQRGRSSHERLIRSRANQPCVKTVFVGTLVPEIKEGRTYLRPTTGT